MEDCSNQASAGAGAVAGLPDDLLVEILSRVPAKSVCRFKCVSKAWRDLIADPDHRKMLRQPMQGLLFMTLAKDRFIFSSLDLATAGSVPPDVDDPAGFISFLTEQPGIHRLVLRDSCNGLILFRHHMEPPYHDNLGYVVCNPTTKQWRAVPACGSRGAINHAYLAFDPAVSSHFHLVQFQSTVQFQGTPVYMASMSVHAYSSETGTWSHSLRDKGSQTKEEEGQLGRQPEEWHQNQVHPSMTNWCAFVNGFLHLIVCCWNSWQIVAVDVQGRARRMIRLPDVVADDCGNCFCVYFGQSQGYLHCITKELFDFYEERFELSIWVLQDYDAQEWVLRDTVSSLQLFGEKYPGSAEVELDSEVADMHLDCNVVFIFSRCKRKFIAYDMDSKKVSVFGTSKCINRLKVGRHVPCFSDSPAPLK